MYLYGNETVHVKVEENMKQTPENHHENEWYPQVLMDQNPFELMFLLRKKDFKYEISYANELGISTFGQMGPSVNALSYFGTDVWAVLFRCITKLAGKEQYSKKVDLAIQNETRHFHIRIFKEKTADLICITLIDETESERMRKQLLTIQDRYSSILNNNLDPLITVNTAGEILFANPAACKVFGYRKDEWKMLSVYQLVGERWQQNFQFFIQRGFEGESIQLDDCSVQHHNGDYLPVYMKAIPVSVKGVVDSLHLIIRDTSDHVENKEKLFYLSYHDHLTGLWNRRALKEHLKEDMKLSELTLEELTILYVDLDRFKLINESLGYNSGDELLRRIAERLSNFSSQTERLYRHSGDEFVFVLHRNPAKAEDFAKRVLQELNKPFYINHQEYFISASIGMAVYPADGYDLDTLLRKADHAVHYVKERGRAGYRFFKEEMNHSLANDALLESHLRRAIELNELVVFYQPQVDLRSNQINSFEALLRWNNPTFGFVSPATFIPIAEESGLILQIGDWVLEQVCKQLRDWQNKGFRQVRIAVNISPKQFKTESFAKKIGEMLKRYGIHSSSLEVEITESAMTNTQETLSILKELKTIGVVISIDDFGTGYSSLSYLKRYPIDIIKIDQTFIRDIEMDEKNAAIAKTIIQLAHNLGLEVVAEGVEKDQEVDFLKEVNCQKAQGYFFSRPVPIHEIVENYMMH